MPGAATIPPAISVQGARRLLGGAHEPKRVRTRAAVRPLQRQGGDYQWKRWIFPMVVFGIFIVVLTAVVIRGVVYIMTEEW